MYDLTTGPNSSPVNADGDGVSVPVLRECTVRPAVSSCQAAGLAS
jgi:hypothetical protein